MADMDSVRVALRIRPLVRYERATGCQEAVERTPGAAQVIVNRSDPFTFNYVFDATDPQELVYRDCVLDMLNKLFDGFNATILAYGQTGSGKTYTMGTAFDGVITEDVGVIPRAMVDIFERVQQLAGEVDFVVKCSFMELYQEQLFDLLSNKSRDESIVDIREDRTGIIIPGLTEVVVNSAKETTDCLVRGSSGRAVASTAMNEQSSRSHAIFTLTLQATKRDELNTVTISKFHLVDLAGSERSKKTQASGERFKEGVKINQGLLALGNVISALGSGQGSGFVRYRDSKLTRLLQDSLGGNSITLMIACVSPADYNVNETLSTLRYADRARRIKNKPIVNQDPRVAEINHLKSIIQKQHLAMLASNGGIPPSLAEELQKVSGLVPKMNGEVTKPAQGQQSLEQQQAHQRLQEKYLMLQQQMQVMLHDVAENEMRVHLAEAKHEKLKSRSDEISMIVNDLRASYAEDARFEKLQQLIQGLNEELEITQSDISEHKQRLSINSSTDNADPPVETAEMSQQMQEHADAFTNKQVELKEQIRRINRELNLKEVLHQRVRGNLNKFCGLEDNIEEKVKECEAKIQELEAEKLELMEKLKHVKDNASAKLAEERRKRLQALEQEINEYKRKNVQQAKMLKVREKETQKIQNLNSEIQAMKENKVKLIRTMRQESEYFRQWKLTREKELIQLRNKGRKMENEMARKEMLNTKQQNVLRRKCEEALAINKRLKEAMDRHTMAQSQRKKNGHDNKGAMKMEQVLAIVDREYEVIISLYDAELSLEQLMEDRGIISSRIAELQQQADVDSDAYAAKEKELHSLQEELDIRNAQIADLQQKVCAADLEARLNSLCDPITTVAFAHIVIKHLFTVLQNMRRELTNQTQAQRLNNDELRTQLEACEERYGKLDKRIRLMELEHEEALAERENTYEEKIAVLLRELYNAPQLANGAIPTPEQEERMKIQEEQLNRMDEMREELERYKQLALQKTKRKKKLLQEDEVVDLLNTTASDIEYEYEDDDPDDDPDWKKTPLYKKPINPRQRTRRTTALGNTSDGSTMDDTFMTAASNAARNNSGKQRRRGCSCRSGCNSKRCGCHSSNEKCSDRCKCSDDCLNGKYDADSENTPPSNGNVLPLKRSMSDSNENTLTSAKLNELVPPSATTTALPNQPLKVKQEQNTLMENTFMTPKMARLSTITFETPSAKKKFFQ